MQLGAVTPSLKKYSGHNSGGGIPTGLLVSSPGEKPKRRSVCRLVRPIVPARSSKIVASGTRVEECAVLAGARDLVLCDAKTLAVTAAGKGLRTSRSVWLQPGSSPFFGMNWKYRSRSARM
jgi:hypothetical protein